MLIVFLKIILLLIVIITPLLGATLSYGFEEIKVLIFTVLVSAAGSLFIYLLLTKQLEAKWSIIKSLSLGFTLVLLITSLSGVDPKISLFGQSPYYQGFIVYFYLYIFMLMVSSLPINLKWYSYTLVFSASLVSVLIYKEWYLLNIANLPILSYASRPIATFGQPNLAAGFILLCLPFLYLVKYHQSKSYKIVWILILLIFIGAIIATYSRAAIFLLLLLALFYLSFKISKSKVSKFIVSAEIILLMLMFLYISYIFSTGLLYQEIQRPQTIEWLIYNSPEKRVFIWPAIWQAISKKPLLGYGLENIPKAFPAFQPHERRPSAFYKLKDLVIDRSHNYTLDLLVFSGIFGLLAWILFVSLLIIARLHLIRVKQISSDRDINVLLVSLVLYLVWIQLQIQSIVHLMYFYLIAGLIEQDNY